MGLLVLIVLSPIYLFAPGVLALLVIIFLPKSVTASRKFTIWLGCAVLFALIIHFSILAAYPPRVYYSVEGTKADAGSVSDFAKDLYSGDLFTGAGKEKRNAMPVTKPCSGDYAAAEKAQRVKILCRDIKTDSGDLVLVYNSGWGDKNIGLVGHLKMNCEGYWLLEKGTTKNPQNVVISFRRAEPGLCLNPPYQSIEAYMHGSAYAGYTIQFDGKTVFSGSLYETKDMYPATNDL